MTALEDKPVEIRFFKAGSLEQVDTIEQAANLGGATETVRKRFPEAAFVRCCEHEPDGGCVFVYANAADLKLDEDDASGAETEGQLPENYGRWVGLISSAASDEPACTRPSSHGV